MPHLCWTPCVVQSMHACPNCPHTAVVVPGWHVPLESQQPPLHVC
jgi:hypothetical protein